MSEIVIRNPATGDEISRHPEIDADTLRSVISTARIIQKHWGDLPLNQRKEHVTRMRDWLVEHSDHIAETIGNCMGKTRFEALAFDVMPSVFGNAWYCKHARKHLAPEKLKSGSVLLLNKKSILFRKPLGVIGIIAPWNYPLGIPMHEIVPALLAGNSVVFKTAPETIPVGILIEEMCESAGLPDGVFNHVVVDGPLCGDVMLEKGGVDKLFFTGSVRVGKLLAEKAAKNLVPVSLELGGKDAMVVLDDANIPRAVSGALWGGMQNAGQSCAGVERVYVHNSVHDDFLTEARRQLEQLRQARDTDGDIGVLTTERQRNTVNEHVREALEQGAREFVKANWQIQSPQQYLPTLLTNVTHDMRVMREETFGPVIGVMPFSNDDEAIALSNDSPYALTASVWSRNARRAETVARRLEAGAVMINDHLMSHGITETPWGGPKDSGLGRGHGRFAFHAMTELQVVVHDRLAFTHRNLWWFPVTQRDYSSIRGAIHAFHGKGLMRRFKGALALLKGLPKMFRKL